MIVPVDFMVRDPRFVLDIITSEYLIYILVMKKEKIDQEVNKLIEFNKYLNNEDLEIQSFFSRISIFENIPTIKIPKTINFNELLCSYSKRKQYFKKI